MTGAPEAVEQQLLRSTIPWEVRIGLWLPTVGWGLFASAILIAAALAFRWLFPDRPGASYPIGLGFATRAALVASITIGYALASWRWISVATFRDLQRLGLVDPAIDVEREEWLVHCNPIEVLRRSRLGGLAGIAFFVFLIEIPSALAGARPGQVWFQLHPMTYMLGLGVLFFWIAGRLAYSSLGPLRVRSLDLEFELDLLDPRPTAIFGRMALRGSLAWVIGLSLSSLVFLNPELELRGSMIVFLPLLLVTLVIAALTLTLPVRGLRRRIAEQKRQELERVRAAIRGDKGALAESRISDQAADLGLGDLIAYLGLIEAVHEWPFDSSTVGRLGLYLLIPVGSWLGGALVERFVSLVLD